jgi:hypothetical protein
VRRHLARSLAALAGALVTTIGLGAGAATWVDEPALSRSTVGLALYGGAPLGGRGDDPQASIVGGGGSELQLGWLWSNGFGLAGVFGAARWSSRGALGQTLRDRDASLLEGYAGVSARFVFVPEAEVSPFVSGLLAVDVLRVRGSNQGDAIGLAAGGALGLRWFEAPWDLWGAIDLRHGRLSAPYDDAERIVTTRLSVVVGVAFEGALR